MDGLIFVGVFEGPWRVGGAESRSKMLVTGLNPKKWLGFDTKLVSVVDVRKRRMWGWEKGR